MKSAAAAEDEGVRLTGTVVGVLGVMLVPSDRASLESPSPGSSSGSLTSGQLAIRCNPGSTASLHAAVVAITEIA